MILGMTGHGFIFSCILIIFVPNIIKFTKCSIIIYCLYLNLIQLKINLSIEDIREMKRNQFKNMLKQKINELAFQYLIKKKR